MSKIYNIPVKWNNDLGKPRGFHFVGTINMPNYNGNQINGTWKEFSGSAYVPPDGMTMWYNYLEVNFKLTQGENVESYTYETQGKYYPERTYSFYMKKAIPLRPTNLYKMELTDGQRMFDPATAELPSGLPLEVTSISAEKVNSISFNSKKIYENITISWDKVSSNACEVELWQNSKKIWSMSPSNVKSCVIPAGTIKTTDACTVKIRTRFIFQGDTYWSDYTTASLSSLQGLNVVKPTNFVMSTKNIYEQIKVSWDGVAEHNYYSRLFVNNEPKITSNWNSEPSINIPHGTIKNSSDNVQLRVKSKISKNGYVAESEESLYTLSGLQELRVEQPKDVRLVGSNPIIEQPIRIAWTNEDSYNVSSMIELWQNGMKIHDKSNILSTEYTIPAGTIQSVAQVQVRVYNRKEINGYVATSTYGSVSLSNLQSYKPAIKDFSLNGTNRDYDITVTPEVDRGDSFSLLINDITRVDSLTIPKGTLKVGTNKIRLTVTQTVGVEIPVSAEYEKQVEGIVEDVPIIYSLEPNSINTNIERSNDVTFSINEFCDEWQLVINGNRFGSGTTNRSISVPANTFRLGNNSITLQVIYTPKYSGANRRGASRTSTFNGYAKPKPPKLDSTSVYNTATPTFTWSCFDNESSNVQTEFTIIVKKLDDEQQIEKRTINQTETSYTMTQQLQNRTSYILSVSIRNKYGLWSDYSSKRFETSFTGLPLPDVQLIAGRNSVTIECSVAHNSSISQLKLFKKEEYGKWVCIAENLSSYDTVVDYTIKSNVVTQYKAQAHSSDGGYSEGLPKEIKIKYDGFLFSNVLNIGRVFKTQCCDVSIKHNRNIVTKVFAGNSLPDIYYDNTNYLTGQFVVQINSKDLYLLEDIIYNGEIFCYRDWRGRKIYCTIVIESTDYVKFSNIYNVTLSFTQVNFTEENLYSKKFTKKIVYLDGTYRLDGSLYLDGYIMDERGEVFVYL